MPLHSTSGLVLTGFLKLDYIPFFLLNEDGSGGKFVMNLNENDDNNTTIKKDDKHPVLYGLNFIDSNMTIDADYNAVTFGEITIKDGAVVTVDGDWTII